jgi:hypothetical protein
MFFSSHVRRFSPDFLQGVPLVALVLPFALIASFGRRLERVAVALTK